MQEIDAQVVVVGCGFAGAVLSTTLAKAGVSVVVLERQRNVPERYRGEIMQPYAVEVYRRCGFLDAIFEAGAARVREFEDICFHEGRAVAARRPVKPSEMLGDEAVILRFRLLMTAIRDATRAVLGDRLLEGMRVRGVQRQEDGRCFLDVVDEDDPGRTMRVTGHLVVAADGAQSPVRRALPFGSQEAPPGYAFAGIVVRADAERFPCFTSMYPLGRGLFGNAFPVRTDEVRFCMAVSHDTSRAAHDELAEIVLGFARDTLVPLGYPVPEEPELAEPLKIEPVFRVRTEAGALDGVCLVGDAAGTVHPITGYGATLACNDVLHLGKLLVEQPPKDVVPASLLGEFEARRRAIRAKLEELSDLYVRIFLGTAEPDVVEAFWRQFTGEDAEPTHDVVRRFDVVGDALAREFDAVEF